MPPTPPPTNLTGWQYIAFFAIVSLVTLVQSYYLHKKIDSSTSKPASPSAPAPTDPEKKS